MSVEASFSQIWSQLFFIMQPVFGMFSYDWLHYDTLSDSVLHHVCIAVMEIVEKNS